MKKKTTSRLPLPLWAQILLPLLVVEPWVEQHLYNGCPTSRYPAADGRYRVRNAAGQFLGLANIVQGVLRVEKLFIERN